ncbi:hypothetical protein EKO04_003329 [Ascochyta lentis]|uniref:Uncharacterized protein n=1 Tax=Ascochyta lentis TaxID=205686 RepID=A0A8H7J8E2_9PLEO|nr:hypothetical protein EKO04_003329 [Ascochyta lentis]
MAAAHRRGGKHTVRDEDLTHTKYDHYTREELLEAVKEAGCYVKDDKKCVMAQRLAKHDQDLQLATRRAAQEQKEKDEMKQQELRDAAKAKTIRRKAREKRNDDRGRRRECGEDVSSNSEDTVDADEQDRHDAQKLTVTGGEALSDETWEDTASETTIHSRNPPIEPECKLRLFEWSYIAMPPKSPLPCSEEEQFPRQLTYAPLKLTTTQTREKITLPGLKYPAGVEPDYVPVLDSPTRSAARHGHMVGLLAHATIEPASTWASRTLIQGWNGRMYFSLPLRDDVKDRQLMTVYQKWSLENAKLLRLTPGATDPKADHKERFAQRHTNKRNRVAEVYGACRWRPLAVSYMPSYLDWEKGVKYASLAHFEKSIDNLYYIRFPGCDLPHYYFWARKSEWHNPMTPDPAWTVLSSGQHDDTQAVANAGPPPPQALYRIKRLLTLPRPSNTSSGLSDFDTTLSSVEFDLCTHGLSETLPKNRALAVSAGNERAWNLFTHKLPALYPSGQLPDAPPVHSVPGMCVAEKIAALRLGQDVPPFNGKESWTRDDDTIWDVVAVDTSTYDAEMESRHSAESYTIQYEANALYRRDSMAVLLHPQDKRIYDWLDRISTAYPPKEDPLSPSIEDPEPKPEPPPSPCPSENGDTCPTCPFCNTTWITFRNWEKAKHMLSHSYTSLAHAATAPSFIHAIGVGAKRRHSRLSISTLRSYHARAKGKKLLRLDSAVFLAERWAKWGREDSPFTKEVKRVRALERRYSVDLIFEDGVEVESCGSEWLGDDEGGGEE